MTQTIFSHRLPSHPLVESWLHKSPSGVRIGRIMGLFGQNGAILEEAFGPAMEQSETHNIWNIYYEGRFFRVLSAKEKGGTDYELPTYLSPEEFEGEESLGEAAVAFLSYMNRLIVSKEASRVRLPSSQ